MVLQNSLRDLGRPRRGKSGRGNSPVSSIHRFGGRLRELGAQSSYLQDQFSQIVAGTRPQPLRPDLLQSSQQELPQSQDMLQPTERRLASMETARVTGAGFGLTHLGGVPLAIRGASQKSIPAAVAMGFSVGFTYFVVLGFARALGQSGALPPLLAAWTGNGIFLLFGAYLVLGAD